MEIVSRKEAIAAGLHHYFTGRPCKNGHLAQRYVNKGVCKQCAAEWARNNYDPFKASKACRRWREKNPAYADKHRDRINKNSRTYRERNKARVAALRSLNRAKKLRASTNSEVDRFVVFEAHDLAALRSIETGIRWEVDHIVPLTNNSVCGLHNAANLQVIPEAENRRKSNKFDPSCLSWIEKLCI